MTILNIANPWADVIFQNGKDVENRSRNLHKRGTVGIYASVSLDKKRFETLKNKYNIIKDPKSLIYGAIIGTVEIESVIAPNSVDNGWYMAGFYGWKLTNPQLFKNPIFIKPPQGAVIFWETTDSLEEKIKSQINRFIRFE